MSDRRRIEERIRKKEAEIQGLDAQIREARAYIQALQDVLKILPRDSAISHTAQASAALRPGSSVALAREVILKDGKPLHISAILQRLGKDKSRQARISLSSSLGAYVRKSDIFTRTAPNTFGLIELGHTGDDTATEPPEDFGTVIEGNEAI